MKPTFNYSGFKTTDLTEARVHALKNPDGSTRIVAYLPKTYTKGEPMDAETVKGTLRVCFYDITDWTEITLMTIPAGATQ